MDSTRNGPNSEGSPAWSDPEYTSLTEKLFVAKKARRVALARLPIEEKVRIIVELQRIAYEIRASVGKPAPKPWDLS